MGTRGKIALRVIGALALAGVTTLAVAVGALTQRVMNDGGERQTPGRSGDRPPPAGNGASPRLPPPGISPGPGGPRDEPVALDAAMANAVLNPDGTVTASGYLVCTPGETMNVGWAIWETRSDRQGGMVRTGERRLYYECNGERQEWKLRGEQVIGDGLEPGLHPYTVKTAVGTGSRHDHRDYFQGTIRVQP